MKKIVLSITALISAVCIQAIENEITLGSGEVSGQIKAMHIITDNDNNWTPNNGSGYLGTLKYVTPEVIEGLKAGAAFYVNGDTGLSDWGDSSSPATDGIKTAQGMFTSVKGEENSHLGQAYLEYNNKTIHSKTGRMILNTPLTKIQWSLMPNFYEAGVLSIKSIPNFKFTLLHINKISYGSRAATDWSLIGEKTKSAGVARPMLVQSATGIEQTKFINIGTAAGTANETDGITTINATYKGIKNLTISIWDYYAHDISNNLYADINYKMPITKGTKLSIGVQYLSQSEIGDKLIGDLDYTMYGAKAKIGNKKWSTFIAYNLSSDSDSVFYNARGADPAYTSSLFSRNAYRQDVSAYKIGGHYTIMKGLKFKASYANYGQSKTLGGTVTKIAANEDATEADIMLIYKPAKVWTFKIFNTIRTSEYNSDDNEYEMNHVRIVAWYDF